MTTNIYYTTLNDYRDDLITLIPEPERQRALKATTQQRKKMIVLGRALLARALEQQTPSRDFEIEYTSQGKPLLRSPLDWHFNLTHSGEHIFLALRKHHAIGIDSEIIRSRPYERLAKKLFDEKSRQIIATADNPMLMFYQYWTMYEAQVKMLGLSVFSDLPHNHNFHLKSFQLNDLMISLCSYSKLHEIIFYQQSFESRDFFIPLNPINSYDSNFSIR